MKKDVATHVLYPGCVTLRSDSPVFREPPRPAEFRPDDYCGLFDHDTLLFDVFANGDGQSVTGIGPPLLNLAEVVQQAQFAIDGNPVGAPRIHELDRCCRMVFSSGTAGQQLSVHSGPMDWSVGIEPSGLDLFKDLRVIFTMQKDNPLEWVRDWVTFNVNYHGANGVLIYDNQSQAYDLETLATVVAGVEGLDTVVVVHWPYKWGPPAISDHTWDSDFCQYGAWEDARWRFLGLAEAALNSDIDERVVTAGHKSIFDETAASRHGYQTYHGLWTIGVESADVTMNHVPNTRAPGSCKRMVRYWDFHYTVRSSVLISPRKWCVVPRVCPESAQWAVHYVSSMPTDEAIRRDMYYRHFWEISTHWRWDRREREHFDAQRHFFDTELTEAVEIAFPGESKQGTDHGS